MGDFGEFFLGMPILLNNNGDKGIKSQFLGMSFPIAVQAASGWTGKIKGVTNPSKD